MKKLENDVMNWLAERYDEAPGEGWRTLAWIASHRGVSLTTADRALKNFIKEKKMPAPKKFRVNGRVTQYYYVGA